MELAVKSRLWEESFLYASVELTATNALQEALLLSLDIAFTSLIMISCWDSNVNGIKPSLSAVRTIQDKSVKDKDTNNILKNSKEKQ